MGNYSLGLKEHIIFPEIDYDKVSDVWGMDITICTTARTDDEARAARGVKLPLPAVRAEHLSNADSQETLMAKKSSIEKNKRRRKMTKSFAGRRSRLKEIAMDKTRPLEERFAASLKLAELPRNCRPDTHSQPLRGDWPSARLLSQAQDVAYRVA